MEPLVREKIRSLYGKKSLTHGNVENRANLIVRRLKKLGAYIYHNTGHGSIYIKFANTRLGSIRVSNHKGYEKNTYKWNVLCVKKPGDYPTMLMDRGIPRFFYPHTLTNRMIKDILKKAKELGINE